LTYKGKGEEVKRAGVSRNPINQRRKARGPHGKPRVRGECEKEKRRKEGGKKKSFQKGEDDRVLQSLTGENKT